MSPFLFLCTTGLLAIFSSTLSHTERGEKLGWFSTATLAGRFLAPVVGGSILGILPSDSACRWSPRPPPPISPI